MGFRRLICAGLVAASLLAGGAERAHAACTSPAGNAGDIIYDAEFRQAQFCNDTGWLPMLQQNYILGYLPHAIYFDGTDDYYTQSGNPANLTDSKTVTGAVWLKRNATGAIHTILAINDRFIFRVTSAGDVSIVAENTADTDILDVTTSGGPLDDTNWHHVIFSIDMANSANNVILVDFNWQTLNYSVNTDQNIDFTVSGFTLGAGASGVNKFNGLISDLWIETGLFVDLLDFNPSGPLLRFVEDSGFPRDLGPNGALAMGYAPDFFISGPYETQGVNKGTAGGFTPAALAFERVGTPLPFPGLDGTCNAVGETCADGTIYAGISADDKLHMYADSADLPGTYTWSNGSNSGVYSPMEAIYGICEEDDDSGEGAACFRGKEMSAFLGTTTAGDAPYLAAQACEQSTAHGYDDWYLPSQAELITLQENAGAYGFAAADYWSSSESHIEGDAQHVTMPTGIWRGPVEDAKQVRCVRKQACYDPTGQAGTIVYNEDHRVLQICDGYVWHAMGDVDPPGAQTGCTTPAGTGGDVVFNSVAKVLQYCDGLNWHSLLGHVQGCGSNPVAGQTCPDGSVYVGLSVDGSKRMYTTPADASTSIQWSNANNIDTALANCTSGAQAVCNTGEANTAYLAGLSNADAPYHAMALCQNLMAHGHDDWYVPSQNELSTVYAARNSGVLAGTFTTGEYWAGNEYNDIWAVFIPFNTGTATAGSKFSSPRRLRCVRKD